MNDDENDYEMIQDMWNPEDPTIYWEEWQRQQDEEAYAAFQEYESNRATEDIKINNNISYRGSKDAFLSTIEAIAPSVEDNRLRPKYDKFIKKHGNIGTAERPRYRQITLNALTYLDPRLLIAYHKYLIGRFSFEAWFALFSDPVSPAYSYLPFLKNNINRLALSQTQKQIILK